MHAGRQVVDPVARVRRLISKFDHPAGSWARNLISASVIRPDKGSHHGKAGRPRRYRTGDGRKVTVPENDESDLFSAVREQLSPEAVAAIVASRCILVTRSSFQ